MIQCPRLPKISKDCPRLPFVKRCVNLGAFDLKGHACFMWSLQACPEGKQSGHAICSSKGQSYIYIIIYIYYILHLYLPPKHLISNRPTSSLLRDPECTQFFSSSKALGSIRSLQKIIFHSFCKKNTQFLWNRVGWMSRFYSIYRYMIHSMYIHILGTFMGQ